MAHLSLYRKFRPNTFEEMVRQEHVVRILKNQIESGAIGHAYLFTGPRGTGKTSVARIFARAVNCERPANGSPCGECPTCLALKEGSLDISEIDAASNNGVGEMRDLREKVQYPPVTGKYKVYIIDEVHMLTDSAFNALLKTLEEPPQHAIFILATTEPHKIPATILSRCMRLDFKLIPEEDLENHLAKILDEIGKPYEREAVAAIARAGAGSDRDMLSIAETCFTYSDKLTYEGVTAVLGAADFFETAALAEALLLSDMSSALEKTEHVIREGKSVGVLCRDLLETLNRVAVAKTCRTAEKLLSLPKTHFGRIREIAEKADGRALLRAIEILARTETDLRFVSSPRICLETALMKIAVPAADDSVDALIVRINELEKKLARLTEHGPVFAAPAVPAELRGPRAPKPVAPEPVAPEPVAPVSAPVVSVSAPEPDYDFPTEEPIFEEAYFSDGAPGSAVSGRPPVFEPEPTNSERPAAAQPVPAKGVPSAEPVPAREIPSAQPVPAKGVSSAQPAAQPAGGMTAELAYGKFMRLLRKTSRNGVLFTMCTDLEASFEGNRLVLETPSGTVLRSLQREEHAKIIAEVFAQFGITDFEIRLKDAAPKRDEKNIVKELQRDFKDYPIEVK